MVTSSKIANISKEISALANVYVGISSPNYPSSCNKSDLYSLENINKRSMLKNIRNEIFRLNESALHLRAESVIEIEARWQLIKDVTRVFGLGSVPVARAARSLSSDAYQLARLTR